MGVVKSAPEAVRLLWFQGFFKNKRTFANVKMELNKQGYNFPDDRLGIALYRAKYLTKLGKRGNYKYIQKYPYFKEGKT